MSHQITTNDPNKHCGCEEKSMVPSKLDELIAKYKTLIAEAEAAKSRFIDAAMSILNFQFEEASEGDIYAMFSGNDDSTNS